MANLLNFSPAQFVGFFFVFSRLSGLMLIAPGFSDQALPNRIRVLLVFVLSLVIFPVVTTPTLNPNPNLALAVIWVMGEVLIGLLLGFAVRLAVAAVELAGEIAGLQMGLGIAGIFNPISGQQVSIISGFQSTLAVLLLFALNGHHLMLEGLVRSYELAPVGTLTATPPLLSHYMRLGAGVFSMGVKVGAPPIAAMLAANIAVGLVARAAPQTNMFIVAAPFTVGLGIAILAMSSPFMVQAIMQVHAFALENLTAPWGLPTSP